MEGKKDMAKVAAEKLREFEENYPDCVPNAPEGTLKSYARLRKDLAYLLWALEVDAAEYLYREASGPEGLLKRMGDGTLLLCAATVYGLLANKPEIVPSRAQREAALAQLEKCVAPEDGEERYTQKYRQICQRILALPERPPKSDEDRIQAIKDGTEAFFQVYTLKPDTEDGIYLTDREREVYIELARPVVEALREGNMAVAKYVTFSLAPDRDPFLAAGDYWIKASAAALWGAAQPEEHFNRAMAMMALIDFYMAYGGSDNIEHEGSIPWPWLGGCMESSVGQGEEYVEFNDWWDMAWHNVMQRLNYYLDFDYVNQFWYRDDIEDLGHIWMKKGIL